MSQLPRDASSTLGCVHAARFHVRCAVRPRNAPWRDVFGAWCLGGTAMACVTLVAVVAAGTYRDLRASEPWLRCGLASVWVAVGTSLAAWLLLRRDRRGALPPGGGSWTRAWPVGLPLVAPLLGHDPLAAVLGVVPGVLLFLVAGRVHARRLDALRRACASVERVVALLPLPEAQDVEVPLAWARARWHGLAAAEKGALVVTGARVLWRRTHLADYGRQGRTWNASHGWEALPVSALRRRDVEAPSWRPGVLRLHAGCRWRVFEVEPEARDRLFRTIVALLEVAPLPRVPDVLTGIAHDTVARNLYTHGVRSTTYALELEVLRREPLDPAAFRTACEDVAPLGHGIDAREPGAIVAALVMALVLLLGHGAHALVSVLERR